MSERPPLLPADHYLMQVLAESGVEISEEDWRAFKAEVKRRTAAAPQPAAVAGVETLVIVSLVAQVISIGLTLIASFFKPKATNPAQLRGNQLDDQSITSQRRYAPRAGFDAVQEPATIGTTVPVVYALREQHSGGTYGGIRISMPLLWSNIQSYGGHQLLRAIFLLSEGRIHAIDASNFAIGNNAIGGYDFLTNSANQLGSRLALYLKPDGGRIRSADRILGRSAGNDQGNAENAGGQDVFAVRRAQGWFQDFSASSRPSTQSTFGVYSLIGNNLGYRVNPSLRPAVNAQLVPRGNKGDSTVVCDIDQVALAQRQKNTAIFSSRSGLVDGSTGSVGASITYRLDNSSDVFTVFSTVIDPASWTLDVTVINTTSSELSAFAFGPNNLIPLGGDTSDNPLRSLVTLTDLTVDTENNRLRTIVNLNETAAVNLMEQRLTRDGTFQINYLLIFRSGDDELQDNFSVTVSRVSTTSLQQNTAGQYTSPQLNQVGEGQYTLTSGSVTFPGVTQVTTTTYTFQPVSQAYEFDYLTAEVAQEKATDAASAISSRQKGWDDAIVIGDLYKIGSALAICTNRSPSDELFESEADFLPRQTNQGRSIEATFTTVRPGSSALTSLADLRVPANQFENRPFRATATNFPHICKIAVASVSTTRPCRVVEIGIRSALGIRLGGLCNFADSLTYEEMDAKACRSKEGRSVRRGTTLKVDLAQSGVLSTAEERFSFFRLSYREAGTQAPFTELPQCFGIRSITQQNAFNALRIRMPDVRQWEFRFEPLTGWEIRSGVAAGPLEVIDSKLSSVRTAFAGSVGVTFNGLEVPRSQSTFSLNSTRRPADQELGIGFTDEDSYADAWGKLAEAFVFEEIQSSAANGPEHEIVYINEIVPNETLPEYDNLAIVGLNIRSSVEFSQFAQFSAYVTGGVICRRLLQGNSPGPTHLFPDVLLDLLTNKRYGRGDAVADEMIDLDSFRSAAAWCQERGYFFDAALVSRQNIRQWAADTAAAHLLIFGEADGRFFLKPAFGFSPTAVKGLFTAGNIREGSFRMQYLEADERLPIQVSVKYREERAVSNLTNPGLFATEREILVREASVPDTAPIESIDLSDFATNPRHAIDAAKYIARFRRLTTHGIQFETTYEGLTAGLAPGDYIRVAMDFNVYDEFNNGVVTSSGALVATQELTNGAYSVIQWNGDNSTVPSETTLTVTENGKRATPTGIVFTVKRTGREVNTYQVESIAPNESGYLVIEAVHMPTDSSGRLRLASAFDNDGSWIIQR